MEMTFEIWTLQQNLTTYHLFHVANQIVIFFHILSQFLLGNARIMGTLGVKKAVSCQADQEKQIDQATSFSMILTY